MHITELPENKTEVPFIQNNGLKNTCNSKLILTYLSVGKTFLKFYPKIILSSKSVIKQR